MTNENPAGTLTISLFDGAGSGNIFYKPDLFTDFSPDPPTDRVIDSNFSPINDLDMFGYHLTKLELDIVSASVVGNQTVAEFELRIFGDIGQIPEPTSIVLFSIAFSSIGYRTPYNARQ